MFERKKILYIIFSNNIGSGAGGHYYSLKTLSNSLRFDNDISIINIGFFFSKVLKNQPFKIYFIKHKNLISSCLLLKRLIKEIKPDIIHTFDLASLTLLKIIMNRKQGKYIHTHCGGPNPSYYLYTPNLILFSQENYMFFKKDYKFNETDIFLIPNRVLQIIPDSERINTLLNEINFKFPIFLRICRINKFYVRSLIQSINLVKKIIKRGKNAYLLIIGVPDDFKVLKFIKKYENNNIKIVTQEKYTLNANQLIEIADFVIGTGRGFMEGAYFNKVMLTPQKNQNIPLLIDHETFNSAFNVNFSERTIYQKYNEETNFERIYRCINDKGFYNELASFIKDKSKDYFEILSKKKDYNELYNNLELNYLNRKNSNLLGDCLKTIKILYNYNIIIFFKHRFLKILKVFSRYNPVCKT